MAFQRSEKDALGQIQAFGASGALLQHMFAYFRYRVTLSQKSLNKVEVSPGHCSLHEAELFPGKTAGRFVLAWNGSNMLKFKADLNMFNHF